MECKVCNGLKMIEIDGYMKRCECLRKENFLHFLDWSGLEKNKRKELLKRVKQLENRKIFFEYEEDGEIKKQVVDIHNELNLLIGDRHQNIRDNYKLLLKGTNGRGKTQFAVTLAVEILFRMDLDKTPIDINRFFFFNPMTLITDGTLFDQDVKKEILRKVEKADVLILDELGEELEMFQYDQHQKKYLANDKRVNELHTFILGILNKYKGLLVMTTNSSTPEEEYKKISPRMHSRLFTEGSMSKYVFVGSGLDERSKKQAANKKKYTDRFK